MLSRPHWRDLTATLVFNEHLAAAERDVFAMGQLAAKIVSRFHSCLLSLGCGISFCGGFVNSAKLFLENIPDEHPVPRRMKPNGPVNYADRISGHRRGCSSKFPPHK